MAPLVVLGVAACGSAEPDRSPTSRASSGNPSSALVGKWAGTCFDANVVIEFFPADRAIEKYELSLDPHELTYSVDGGTLTLVDAGRGQQNSGKFSIAGDSLSVEPAAGDQFACALTRRPGLGIAAEMYLLGDWSPTEKCGGDIPYLSSSAAGNAQRAAKVEFLDSGRMIADDVAMGYSLLSDSRMEVSGAGAAVVFDFKVSADTLTLDYRSSSCTLSRG